MQDRVSNPCLPQKGVAKQKCSIYVTCWSKVDYQDLKVKLMYMVWYAISPVVTRSHAIVVVINFGSMNILIALFKRFWIMLHVVFYYYYCINFSPQCLVRCDFYRNIYRLIGSPNKHPFTNLKSPVKLACAYIIVNLFLRLCIWISMGRLINFCL